MRFGPPGPGEVRVGGATRGPDGQVRLAWSRHGNHHARMRVTVPMSELEGRLEAAGLRLEAPLDDGATNTILIRTAG